MKTKTIAKISETKSSYFKMIDKIDKVLTRATKKKLRTQTTNVKNVTGYHYRLGKHKKKIIREHYGQLFTQIFDNLDEMNQFFVKHKLLPIIQYKIDNLNSSIANKEMNL